MSHATTRTAFLLLCLWLWLQGASAWHQFEHPLHLCEDTNECLVFQCTQRPAITETEWVLPVLPQHIFIQPTQPLSMLSASDTPYSIRAPPHALTT